MGADRRLASWEQVVSYFNALAASSPRVRVQELGKTTEGRPMIAAFLASPETLRTLDRYREIQHRLADPRLTTPNEAASLAASGKAVVLITCSIHSTEVASTLSAVELAYRLASEDTPRVRSILDNVILILVPSLNPDGVDIVKRWYDSTLGTPYEGTAPPELYQKFTGHDNNRDWYFFTQPETRLVVAKLHNVWHPQIVYDVHQQGPFGSRMFLPPWLDPMDANADPALIEESNAITAAMAADLADSGRTGIVIHALYDFWSPARQYSAYHAGIRILSESASARLASPIDVLPEQIALSAPGFHPREQSWNYLEPWLGGHWTLGDIVSDQLVTLESCLDEAARRREQLLRNFYRIGRRAVERPAPFAFLIPMPQRDPGAAGKLVETLRFGGVEVEHTLEPAKGALREYAQGSFIVRMRQPYSSFAKTLLETQHYPDLRQYPGGPPRRPYDVTAQTLPLLMGVSVDSIGAELQVASRDDGAAPSSGDSAILPATDTGTWRRVNRGWASSGEVWRDEASGDFILRRPLIRRMRRIARPRIGVYKSYVPAVDEGWTRWVLEQFGFAYLSLSNGDIEAGSLEKHFDTIVFPDERPADLRDGFPAGSMPPEYTGGLDAHAVDALGRFVQSGGTLIFLNRSARFALSRLGLPVHDLTGGLSTTQYYCPGSLLNVRLDSASPLRYGLPETFSVWNEQSPVWDVNPAPGVHTVLRYPHSGILASGWLLGADRLADKSPLLVVDRGAGRVVLFAMRPQYRAQSYLTFKLFFNALILGRTSGGPTQVK